MFRTKLGEFSNFSRALLSPKADQQLISQRNRESDIVYPMHPACWRIFCQQYALLATQTPTRPNLDALGAVFASQAVEKEGRGLQPDWTTDYAGVETFWGDGWAWTEDIETSEIGQLLDGNAEYDFLVLDPERIELPNTILRRPPLLSIGE